MLQARGRRLAAAIVALALTAARVEAESVKCTTAIIGASAAFAQAQWKARTNCEGATIKGKRPVGDCGTDAKTVAALAKAHRKLQRAIAQGCGGKNKTCNDGDDDALASVGWAIGRCPDFGGAGCTGGLASCDDVAACLACIGAVASERAIALTSDDRVPTDPKTERQLNRCQVAIGKAAWTSAVARSRSLAKCWAKVARGKVAGPCPSPGDGKTTTAIAKADAKARKIACKACGGADQSCGGGDDFLPSDVGFPGECPAVTGPSGTICGGTVTTLEDLVTCVRCVTSFTAACSDLSAIPGLAVYPAGCRSTATPTPSPAGPTPSVAGSSTPTPTATETGAATSTPTPTGTAPDPTATASPSPTSSATSTVGASATPTPEPTPTETATPTPSDASTTTPTATPSETPTTAASATPSDSGTATATPTPTETATPTATPSPYIAHTPALNAFVAIDVGDTAQSPPTDLPRQRVRKDPTPLAGYVIDRIDVCLGRSAGNEVGRIHFEIWSDSTVGCAGGAPYCPGAKIGGNSDDVLVDGLAFIQNVPDGACGTPNNGETVAVTWSADVPDVSDSFWIVGVNDGANGYAAGQVRWGASGDSTSYEDAAFDAWKGNAGQGLDTFFGVYVPFLVPKGGFDPQQ